MKTNRNKYKKNNKWGAAEKFQPWLGAIYAF